MNTEPLLEFHIAGVQHGDYAKVKGLSNETEIKLTPEPENLYDENAIRIDTKDGIKLGYVPRALTEYIHPYLQDANLIIPRLSVNLESPKLHKMLKVALFKV